ncbi:relaxase/mobilization nuclease domain-containing protein [Lutibacter sp.]
MIIAYSKHGQSGGVKYAINNKTAKVLAGDPELTEQLIKQNKNKLKYRSGIISFEEKNPPKEVVQDVIDNFIKSTFAGLEPEQYNILLVEHTNTDNYHIHFTIPRIELSTGKSFNPHWHKEDQKRLLKLQDYLNAKHGLSNPFEIQKAKTLQDIDFKALNRNKAKEEINSFVEKLVIERRVQNRDELIKYFTESGIDVVRQSKSFITIKIDDVRIRLKGIYYADTFTDIRAVGTELQKREREHTATTPKELERIKQELDRLIQYKARINQERYKQTNKRRMEKAIKEDRRNILGIQTDNQMVANSTSDNSYDRRSDGVLGRKNNNREEQLHIKQKRMELWKQQQERMAYEKPTTTTETRRVDGDDSTRTAIIRRIRAEQEARERADRQAKQTRAKFYRKLRENCERQQEEFRAVAERIQRLNGEAERDRATVTEVTELRQRTFGRFIGAVRNFTDTARSYLKKVKRGIDNFVKSRKITRVVKKQKKKKSIKILL